MAIFTGTAGTDTITPFELSSGVTADPETALPSEAADVINGLGGDDFLDGGWGRDEIRGGDGADEIMGDGALYGDAGDDTIYTNGDVDTTAYGGTGNDTFYGYVDVGTLSMFGDDGDDVLRVNSDDGDPVVYLSGGDGNDTLEAASNFNNAPFGVGTNTLEGGAGDDTYVVYKASDSVIEAEDGGIDTLASWANAILPANVENLTMLSTDYFSYENVRAYGNELDNVIRGNTEDNVLYGKEGDDTIYGRDEGLPSEDIYGDAYADNDEIHGGDGNDWIFGDDGTGSWDGDDTLYGEDGEDRISGGLGNDVLVGGIGRDVLDGGTGSNVYRYESVEDSMAGDAGDHRDYIVNFTGVGDIGGDKIDLSLVDADATTAGLQHFTLITGALTEAGQLQVVEAASGGGSIVRGEVDGVEGADFAIYVQDGDSTAASWTAEDFILM